jgi:hypothetical protein
LSPTAFLLPIVAFLPLLTRNIAPQTVWLLLVALLAAFLLKQDNPPAGDIYRWFFSHAPGWRLFRDASKLYFIVALSYAVLVPLGLRLILRSGSRRDQGFRRFNLMGAIVAAAVVIVIVLPVIPLAIGQIGYTTEPTTIPRSFEALETRLNSDKNYGPVIWFGGAVLLSKASDHHFRIGSAAHPVLELTGTDEEGDFLTSFCPTPSVAFCYLDEGLFPYLLARIGAAYVVLPESSGLGLLAPGISTQWLDGRLRATLGSPSRIGANKEELAVWQLPQRHSPVVAAPAAAVVSGPPEVTRDILPALRALSIPVVYGRASRSVGSAESPAIEVIPQLNGRCRIDSKGQFVLLAAAGEARMGVLDGRARLLAEKILTPARLNGWGVYGPVTAAPGDELIPQIDAPVPACLAWSPVTKAVLTGEARAEDIGRVTLDSETVVAAGRSQPQGWLELKRTYDQGWQLSGSTSHLVGDTLFNLYSFDGGFPTIRFEFSTAFWETVGSSLSLAWALLAGLLIFVRARRPGIPMSQIRATGEVRANTLNPVAKYLALTGIVLLGVACAFEILAWWGAPSRMPALFSWMGLAVGRDPYAASAYYVVLAFFALVVATALRFAGLAVQPRAKT